MDFQLTPEQEQFRASVLGFSQKNLSKGARERAHKPEYPWDVAKLMAKQGLLGITVKEADGGQGGTLMDAVIAIETDQKTAAMISSTNRSYVHVKMSARSSSGQYFRLKNR